MTKEFSAKNELKKTFLTEPFKIGIGIVFGTYVLPSATLFFPAVRELLFQSIPVWVLPVFVLPLLSLLFVLIFLWRRSKRETNQSEPDSDPKGKIVEESAHEPDEVDLQILKLLYHDELGMSVGLIAQVMGMAFGDADFRLDRLKDSDFVHTPGWMVGSGDYRLTKKAKELVFALESGS